MVSPVLIARAAVAAAASLEEEARAKVPRQRKLRWRDELGLALTSVREYDPSEGRYDLEDLHACNYMESCAMQ
ncbi:hypothetical protein CLOM_g1111 [Closterium sp. NIES-68]|nr:hypothetical protein CLOM_g1111 [Closterium sp. NIES-68]GJP62106.1 hypothetical protein CLOP_g19201 [Closterium sp. NIES-67]